MLTDKLEELIKFIPYDIHIGAITEYTEYHARALSVNEESDLHTYSYFAWHIMWMSFLQKITFMLYKYDPNGVVETLGQNEISKINNIRTPYDLSLINEKKLCEITKHEKIGFHHNKVKNVIELVDKRDSVAHCSGVIDLEHKDVDYYIERSLNFVKELQVKLEDVVASSWDGFVADLVEHDNQYSLLHDAAIDYISKEHLSIKDMLTLVKLRIATEQREIEKTFTEQVLLLHLVLILEDQGEETSISSTDLFAGLQSSTLSDEQRRIVEDELTAYNHFHDLSEVS